MDRACPPWTAGRQGSVSMEWRGRRGSRTSRTGAARAAAGPRGWAGSAGQGRSSSSCSRCSLGSTPASFSGPGGGQAPAARPPVELTAEDKAEGEFVSVVLADTEEIWTRRLPGAAGHDLPPGDAGPVQGGHPVRLRRRVRGDGAVLLPGRQEGLSGHRLLHDAAPAAWGGRRFRRRLCRRP